MNIRYEYHNESKRKMINKTEWPQWRVGRQESSDAYASSLASLSDGKGYV